MNDQNPLNSPIKVGSMLLRNRLYRAPALEGAGQTEDPVATYTQHFLPNAEAGVGLIIQGTTMVTPEGRSSPGMITICDRKSMLAFQPMTQALHRHGAKIVLQLGHAGMYAIEDWHQDYRKWATHPPLAVSHPTLWQRFMRRFRPVHVLRIDEILELAERFGKVAGWAREAGYDGIQLSSSNGKLLHQFLSSCTNRRDDAYGGSVWERTLFLRQVRAAIARHAGEDFPILLKYPGLELGFFKDYSGGISLKEGMQIAQIAEAVGFSGVTPVSTCYLPNFAFFRGGYPQDWFQKPHLLHRVTQTLGSQTTRRLKLALWLSALRYPYQPIWNRQVFQAVKSAVTIPVFAVGGIRTPKEANALLDNQEADLVGLARPFYADPDLPAFFLNPQEQQQSVRCQTCNMCTVPLYLGMRGGCYNSHLPKRIVPELV